LVGEAKWVQEILNDKTPLVVLKVIFCALLFNPLRVVICLEVIGILEALMLGIIGK
jgi:hypothetical protein